MMRCATLDALLQEHPQAIELALRLERDGFTLQYETDDDCLTVTPSGRPLTAELRQQIRQHIAPLKLLYLVLGTDDEVVQRRMAFQRDLSQCHERGLLIPGFVFRPQTAYVRGACFSCGDQLPALRWGRCWRCSIAWRLAAGVPIRRFDASTVLALDQARVAS